jgi:hypothetical protein
MSNAPSYPRKIHESIVGTEVSPSKTDMRPPSERNNNLFRDCPPQKRDPNSKSMVR